MAARVSPALHALRKLEQAARRGPARDETTAGTRSFLRAADGTRTYFAVSAGTVRAEEAAIEALAADVSFEHIDRVADAVARFTSDAVADPTANVVQLFVDENWREPMNLACYIPIEHLEVDEPFEVGNVRFCPIGDPSLPVIGPGFSMEAPIASVAVVDTAGTNYGLMSRRAKATVAHSLQVLRAALATTHPSLIASQLRFRAGSQYTFGPNLTGWSALPDRAFRLQVGAQIVETALTRPLARLPDFPSTNVQRKANVALGWIDRATFSEDQLVSMLFLFFALEAILGDRSEGLKAKALAYRRAMLSHHATGHFADPDRIWLMYDQIRSDAVHGGDADLVNEEMLRSFARDVVIALDEYLDLAIELRSEKHADICRFLDNHVDRQKFADWLHANANPGWDEFFSPRNDTRQSDSSTHP